MIWIFDNCLRLHVLHKINLNVSKITLNNLPKGEAVHLTILCRFHWIKITFITLCLRTNNEMIAIGETSVLSLTPRKYHNLVLKLHVIIFSIKQNHSVISTLHYAIIIIATYNTSAVYVNIRLIRTSSRCYYSTSLDGFECIWQTLEDQASHSLYYPGRTPPQIPLKNNKIIYETNINLKGLNYTHYFN